MDGLLRYPTRNGVPPHEFLHTHSSPQEEAKVLLALLEEDPFKTPPPLEKLVGDLSGAYSRRITIQHRLVYQVFESEKIARVLRMWTQYE